MIIDNNEYTMENEQILNENKIQYIYYDNDEFKGNNLIGHL